MNGSCRTCVRQRGGFSLLEIVLALAIAAIAMSMLSQLVGVANRSAAVARDQTKAQLIAQSIMAEFAAGVMLPQSTKGDWELDPMWSYDAQVTSDASDNLNIITVTVTHNVDVAALASFSLTQWLFVPPEPDDEAESSESSSPEGRP